MNWHRGPGILLVLVALFPSAYLAWQFRDMPHFGAYDDGIYWVCAKSLAEGRGFRTISIPGEPYQTQYPPLFPALLSLIWRMQSAFPSNLAAGTALAWLAMPLLMGGAWMFGSRSRMRGFATGLCVLLALSPFAVLFSLTSMPDLLFSGVVLIAAEVAQQATGRRRGLWWSACAGLLAGAACLLRSAGFVLLLSCPAVFVLSHKRRLAAMFLLVGLPPAAAWLAWSLLNSEPSSNGGALMFSNYLDQVRYSFSFTRAPGILSQNLRTIATAPASILAPASSAWRPLEVGFAVVTAAGILYLVLRSQRLHYWYFCGLYVVLLVIWPFPLGPRFFLPLAPALASGFLGGLCLALGQARRLAAEVGWISVPKAMAFGTVSVGALLFLAFSSYAAQVYALPAKLESSRSNLAGLQPAYEWISSNLPSGARILASNPAVAYLYTGRLSAGPSVVNAVWYRGPAAGQSEWWASAAAFAGRYRLDYLLVTRTDLPADRKGKLPPALAGFRLIPAYQSETAGVYRLEK